MADEIAFRIHSSLVENPDVAADELREKAQERCEALAREFPEITHLEVSLTSPAPGSYEAAGHVTGKATELASHATAEKAEPAVEKLLHTLRQQLRKTHDKKIFQHRRDGRG
ncbi:MAG: HPF/RaiA family ribosome-associated protein [Myxococcota bacterium]|nr:HPF/RaiA family ribosome-associated protein [Myxococcota bacterium]